MLSYTKLLQLQTQCKQILPFIKPSVPVTVIVAYQTLTRIFTVLYPPAGDVLWWHTAAWPTGPATSSSTGRRRCGRPSSARWTPRLTATGAAPMVTSLWSPALPHRRTRMSCWPPPRHLRKRKNQKLDAVTEETETHKGHKGGGGLNGMSSCDTR